MPKRISNRDIVNLLTRIAGLLEAKEESPFRVRSYRNAAASISEKRQPLWQLLKSKGVDSLTSIKGVGDRLAGLIQEYINTGQVELLKTLEKEVSPEKVQDVSEHQFEKPLRLPVGLILKIDEEYRSKAAANKLKKIAPRLLNPGRKAWLPILLTTQKGYKFTVMFSNTKRAHERGKTDDWVVVYYEKGEGENQCTVVTETRGKLKGKRVIRGRETECMKYHNIR